MVGGEDRSRAGTVFAGSQNATVIAFIRDILSAR
jgi:hypothetical protein